MGLNKALNNLPIYLSNEFVLTPLGNGADVNFDACLKGRRGVKEIHHPQLLQEVFYASMFSDAELKLNEDDRAHTRFDSLLLLGISEMKRKCPIDLSSEEVLIILASTKGNVELLQTNNQHQPEAYLHHSARMIQHYFQNPNTPIIVSNACISGISATIVAHRYLKRGQFKHALIIGCDVLSSFIIKGFHSFKAMDMNYCKPFDAERRGVNLGEAFAAVLMSCEIESAIVFDGGCISNDANHISGPSNSGEELSYCIRHCLALSGQPTQDEPDFIVAHGTATPYNDEMEAKAIALSGLSTVPTFSLKQVFGHTLGASGLLEMIMGIQGLKNNIILASPGYETHGVSGEVNITRAPQFKSVQSFIKTGSGFGGCNAACRVSKWASWNGTAE